MVRYDGVAGGPPHSYCTVELGRIGERKIRVIIPNGSGWSDESSGECRINGVHRNYLREANMIKSLVVGAILGGGGTLLVGAGALEWLVGYEKTCLVDKGYFPLIDGPGDFSIYVIWPKKTDEYISIGLTVPTGTTDTFQITEASYGVNGNIVAGSREAAKRLKARTGYYVRLKLESHQKIRASLWDKKKLDSQLGKIRVIRHGLIENPVIRVKIACTP